MRAQITSTIRWSRFELDPRSRTFRRDGVPLELQPRPFDVLAYLAARLDQTVPRAELIAVGWPGVSVVDNSLSQVIRRIRAALDDPAERPRYLVAVPRVGYRLVGRPLVEGPSPLPEPLIGRDRELEALCVPFRGLRTVVGPRGVGKSRLVREVARVLPVSALVELGQGEPLPVIARSLGARCPPQIPGALRRLGRRTLVLDGVDPELLRDPIASWRELAPESALLLTAQAPLHLPGEEVLSLGPLSPQAAATLLELRAGRPLAGEPSLGPLLEELQGLPCAIEQCALWARFLPLSVLVSRWGPSRAGSLLGPCERQRLGALATLDRPFEIEAAEALGVSPGALLACCAAGLVRFDAGCGRYELSRELRGLVMSPTPSPSPGSG